jgi:DNA repair protein RecO (recombination protein O)
LSARTYPVEAIVLRSRDLGENDRMLTLYTRERGRMTVIAKGARKQGSHLAGCSDALTFCSFLLAHGRQFDYVTQAQPLRSFVNVRRDLSRLGHALVIAELIERATPEHQPNERFYDQVLIVMELFDGDLDPTCAMLWGELKFAQILGYAPVLDRCARCGRELGAKATFSADAGGLMCGACPAKDGLPLTEVAVAEMRALQISSEPPHALKAAGAIRRALRRLWGHVLDAELKSDRFLDDVLN